MPFGRKDSKDEVQELRQDLQVFVEEAIRESFRTLTDQLITEVRQELRDDPSTAKEKIGEETQARDNSEDEEAATNSAAASSDGFFDPGIGQHHFRMNAQIRKGQRARASVAIVSKAVLENMRGALFGGHVKEPEPDRSHQSYQPFAPTMEATEGLDSVATDQYQIKFDLPDQGEADDVKLSVRDHVQLLVSDQYFEHVIGLVVVINAIVLGVETDYESCGGAGPFATAILNGSETFFCVVFFSELGLRLWAHGFAFFSADNWAWNIFDLSVVVFQVAEQCVHLFMYMKVPLSLSFLRLLRVLRLVRITRLVRLVRLFQELGTIMSSILASLTALFWTLLLLVMLMYIVSVVFTQIIVELPADSPNAQEINYWYGRLPRSLLTMFEVIAGGVSWDEVVTPLIEDISPAAGVIFSMYVAFCVFAMLNMATGVFVDRAIRKAQEDTDTYTTNHISKLFFTDLAESSAVTFTEFLEKMETKEMQEYFRSINVDPSEARSLFELLDADGSGSVDPEELINGCLRLRGTAKALELQMLLRTTCDQNKKVLENQHRLIQEITKLTGAPATKRMSHWQKPSASGRRPSGDSGGR